MDDIVIPGEVGDDAVAGILEGGGVFLVFVHHALRSAAGGMNEAGRAGGCDD